MRLNLNQTNQKGFTLVEVLIALAILAIGLLMAANLQTMAIAGNKSSSEMSIGTLLGQQVIEQLLIYDPSSDPALTAGTHTAVTEAVNHPKLFPANTTYNGVNYNLSYTVSANTPILGIWTIVMNIQWTDKTSHQVVLVERTTAP